MVANGVPVVVSENGIGFPVHPVEADAPLLKIAENGLGAPIVIVDDPKAPPFIINGYSPQPVSPPFEAFTVYAGAGNSGDTGYYTTIYGSISTEPLANHNMVEFATRNSNYTQVAFDGDCVSEISGWRPIIPGTTIGALISDWNFDGETTSATWESTGQMSQGSEYPIDWEQM